jgi:hypothetical protein
MSLKVAVQGLDLMAHPSFIQLGTLQPSHQLLEDRGVVFLFRSHFPIPVRDLIENTISIVFIPYSSQYVR